MKDFKIALLWCGATKVPETLLYALGHLWWGFCLIPIKIQHYGNN